MKRTIALLLVFILAVSSIQVFSIERYPVVPIGVSNDQINITATSSDGLISDEETETIEGNIQPMGIGWLYIAKLIFKYVLVPLSVATPIIYGTDFWNEAVSWVDANYVREYGYIADYDSFTNETTVVAIRLYWQRISHLQASSARYYNGTLRFVNDDYTRRIQHTLNVFGTSLPIAEDGSFGPGTKSAVKAFQEEFGLVQDGSVGPATYEMLSQVNRY